MRVVHWQASHSLDMQAEDTTRRLLFGAPPPPTATTRPLLDEVSPRASTFAPPATSVPPPQTGRAPLVSAEDEAEAALRYLEAEWAVRMEAPLSALAALEENVNRAIDAAEARLPFLPPRPSERRGGA